MRGFNYGPEKSKLRTGGWKRSYSPLSKRNAKKAGCIEETSSELYFGFEFSNYLLTYL